MDRKKLVLVGAGSAVFTRGLVADLIQSPDLGPWDLGLVDNFESLLKNMFFDSAGFGGWLPVMKSAFEVLGPDHICFGTDYPYELRDPKYVKQTIDHIMTIDASNEDKEKFLGTNLKTLFRI